MPHQPEMPDLAELADIPNVPLGFSHRELRWCLQLQQRLCHTGINAMLGLVSRLGNGVFWYTLMLVILASGSADAVPAFTRMAAVGLIGVLLYKWLKKTTSRPRPCARNGRIVARVAPLDEFSFPSGHTLHAVAFTIVATAYFPWLALLLVPFTLLVALSRVVLGLHYPSDVLAGALLGTALATGVLLW